jgi:NACHT domain-containing protein
MRLRFDRRSQRIRRMLSGMVRSRRLLRTRRAVDERRTWRPSRPLVQIVKVGSALGGVLLLALIGGSVFAVVSGRPSGFLAHADSVCGSASFSCNILSGILGPILSLALASAIFLLVRLWLVARPYRRRAREEPQRLVQTAGSMIGQVVGRDELCHVLIEDIRDPRNRRPHVVIGGVGAGKTALLVRLTAILAERGAVPVPVRLRDAQDGLDFRELARRRFVADTHMALLSDAEGEKVWRELCKNDQIVALADGLEEALIEGNARKERDNLLRLAIRQANEQKLPLIITSRPHDPLRDMEAAIVELEPLSEEAALEYVQGQESRADDRRLDWVVETADVAETPFYLQVTRQLYRAGLMAYVRPRRADRRLDTRSVDRVELRLRLLDSWVRALVDGHFPAGLPLSREDRLATIEQLSLLACVGLRRDRLQVRFQDAEAMLAEPRPPVAVQVDHALGQLNRRFDLRLAATWGTQLGLAEARGDGLRFPHTIMQAYLASRLIEVALADEAYQREALSASGREFLIALVLSSRARSKADGARPGQQAVTAPAGAAARPRGAPEVVDLLLEEARGRRDVKALDLYAAALSIDCVEQSPRHNAIAEELAGHWPEFWARDQRTLEEAKRNLIRRFGESARTISERQDITSSDPPVLPGYLSLYRICCLEQSYPVRLEGVLEIGAGEDAAFAALERVLGPDAEPASRQAPQSGDGASSAGGTIGGTSGSGTGAGQSSNDDFDDEVREERRWQERVVRAWLASSLVGSASEERSRAARTNLERWLQFVGAQTNSRTESDLRLSLEVALAQGFKYAANRRRQHPHARPEARAYLAEQAREMLKDSDFWFTRLTLLHALCLWSLADGPGSAVRDKHNADHRAQISHWLRSGSGTPEHPYVAEAGKLAVLAMETGQPERYIWIDESTLAGKIGSRPADAAAPRKHNLWIPPSTGWTALHHRAQQLLADVLLLLNLAERGAHPSERNRRLRRTDRNDLPPCLGGDRKPLDPTRTLGMAQNSEPGSNCTHGCHFELCPYPPKGEVSYRIELSEAFCRRQLALVSGTSLRRRAATWQHALPAELQQFWRQMGQRAQPAETDGDNRPNRRRSRSQT